MKSPSKDWEKDLAKGAIKFKRLWGNYYHYARRVELLSDEIIAEMTSSVEGQATKELKAAIEGQSAAQHDWQEAILMKDGHSLFSSQAQEEFDIGNPHPKLAIIFYPATNQRERVSLRFPRPALFPYKYGKSHETAFPLSPYNVLAFATQVHDLTQEQNHRLAEVLLGWVMCRASVPTKKGKKRVLDAEHIDWDNAQSDIQQLLWDEELIHDVKDQRAARVVVPPRPPIIRLEEHSGRSDGMNWALFHAPNRMFKSDEPPAEAYDSDFVGEVDGAKLDAMTRILFYSEQRVMDYSERFFRKSSQAIARQLYKSDQDNKVEVVSYEDEISAQDESRISQPFPSLQSFAAKHEVNAEIEEGLSRLTRIERRYLVEFAINGLTYKDIALKYGVSVDTVNEGLSSARKRMRSELPPGRKYKTRKKSSGNF